MTGKKIAKKRIEKGWTQAADLAKATGLSKGYIASIEKGRVKPKFKTVAIIAKCLDIKIEVLLKSEE